MKHTNRPRRRARRALAFAAVAAAGALLAGGCSSDSGGKEAEEESEGNGAGQANTPEMTVAMITHSAPGDTFWDTVKKGAQVAADKDNVDLRYSSDPEVAGQASLIQNAIDQNVDGIAVSLANPDGIKGAIADAQDAGIPVVGINSGMSAWQDMDLLSFFGQDEEVAGRAFGERLNELGAEHALCVIHEQGNIGLEARCSGLDETFEGQSEILYVDGADLPSVQSTIEAKLRQDGSIDFVATLNAQFALPALESAGNAGSDAQVATFDLNTQMVQAIQDGDVQFAVDQQPYLQGYLAVDELWLYHTNGNFAGGGAEPVLTGPAFVDQSNVEEIAKFAENGTR